MGAGEESDVKQFGRGPYTKYMGYFLDVVDKPITWFRETIVVPNRKEYYWYHEKIRRVPTVDECYTDDAVCVYEANVQFKRDKKVDKYILDILRRRYENCMADFPYDHSECDDVKNTWEANVTNYFIKYGDLGLKLDALGCFMKQKNRMAYERRHGPVGSGKKAEIQEVLKKKKQRDKAVAVKTYICLLEEIFKQQSTTSQELYARVLREVVLKNL